VPFDLLPARTAVGSIINGIREFTRARRVTVRLVSPDQRSLVPFYSCLHTGGVDDLEPVPMDPSAVLAAHVVATGEARAASEQTFPGLGREEPLPGVTDRSAYSVPLRLDGRVVGVLTATVPRQSAEPLEETATRLAIGALRVGFELVQARKGLVERLLRPSLRASHATHEIGDAYNRLLTVMKEASEPARQVREVIRSNEPLDNLIKYVAEQLRLALQNIHLDSAGEAAGEVLGAIVDRQVQGRENLTLDGSREPGAVTLAPATAGVVDLAIEQVLRNAAAYSDGGIRLRFSTHTHSARDFVRIHVTTPTAIPPGMARYLYLTPFRTREPDQDRTKLHLGAFLAAVFLRSVGGLVFLSQNDPSAGSETVLEVPVARLAGPPPAPPGEQSETTT
jgi:hypothetical protein